jgi:hypothetical protein
MARVAVLGTGIMGGTDGAQPAARGHGDEDMGAVYYASAPTASVSSS